MPFSVCFEQGICEYNELSHGGCYGDLCGFSCGDEILVFCCHVRIEPACDKGRHEERITEIFPPADDPGLSTQGQLRAQRLASMLVDVDVVAGLDAIYVSPFKRTRETARPLANRLELPLIEWEAENYKGLENKILDDSAKVIYDETTRFDDGAQERWRIWQVELDGTSNRP